MEVDHDPPPPLTQVAHVRIGKVSLLLRAPVRFELFSLAKTRRKIIDDVDELQLVGE